MICCNWETRYSVIWRCASTKYRLSEKEILAIEKAINAAGSPRVEVAIHKNEVVVYQINSKKVKVADSGKK